MAMDEDMDINGSASNNNTTRADSTSMLPPNNPESGKTISLLSVGVSQEKYDQLNTINYREAQLRAAELRKAVQAKSTRNQYEWFQKYYTVTIFKLVFYYFSFFTYGLLLAIVHLY